MKIAVMGAGAVGGYFGGVLANQGEDVTLIARGAHRDAIRRNGLKVDSHWGGFTVKVAATPDPAEVGVVDLILHCVKLYSNAEALPLIKPMVGPGTTVLTIQNGVTSGETIAGYYGAERVLQGATYIEAAIMGPGHIEQSGSTAKIEFGESDGSKSERTERIRKLLDRKGIQVAVSGDIVATLWTKLVAVGAFGTVMTAARATLPEVLAGPEGERTIRTVMEEIVAVGRSEGIKFAPGVVDAKLHAGIEEAEEFKSSLQYDLYNGKPLELDDLLGAVVRKGRDADIPVPASAALVMALEKFKHGKAP
jgi:2-dehydropantoate 2-reductase